MLKIYSTYELGYRKYTDVKKSIRAIQLNKGVSITEVMFQCEMREGKRAPHFMFEGEDRLVVEAVGLIS